MNKKDFCLLFVFLFFINAFAAFAKDNMAVLPFSGGQGEDGETIAELFMFDPTINGAFSLIPRTSITRAMRREQAFQLSGGMTDPDKAVSLGKELGAKYVIAGNIARLGNQNLLVIGIINTETLEQIAGEIQTFAKIEDMPAKLPAMARNIVAATQRDSSTLPKLATTRVVISGSDEAGDILAQILTIYLVQQGSYAVYPRTKSLEQVQAEWDNQTSGNTADKNIVRIGAGENPQLALSCVARRLGAQTMFNASIINLESGVQDTGSSVNYATLNDGIEVMKKLATNLSVSTGTALRVNSEEDLRATIRRINEMGEGNYSIIITGNFSIDDNSIQIQESTNKTITITGDSQMRVISNCYISVTKGIHFVLGNNLTLDGNKKNYVVFVSYGSLTLQDGVVIKNGCGIWNSGTFTMNGGTISGNTAKGIGYGGGITNNGTFTMNGGTISGNSSEHYGGGVGNSGTFTMTGGTISGNIALRYRYSNANGYGGGSGGGVYNTGTFTMTGGTINGNTAEYGGTGGGGGVCSEGSRASFIKTGGTIDAANSANRGKVAYYSSSYSGTGDGYKRDRTAGPNDNLDSSKSGRAGGWE